MIVAAVCGLLGILIERVGLRRLQNSARIAPLLATIGISFVLDQLTQILFSPNPLPEMRIQVGGVSIGSLDILIAVMGRSVIEPPGSTGCLPERPGARINESTEVFAAQTPLLFLSKNAPFGSLAAISSIK